MKYLLIDGNNMAIRNAFANSSLTNSAGIPTGVHYGVFISLMSLKSKFPDYQFLVVWDGKSKRRINESRVAVSSLLIPSEYKANHDKDDKPKPLLDFYEQAPFLQKAIGKLGVPQIRLMDYEADDIIASYCKLLRDDHEIVVVTSDGDFIQILYDNVVLYDAMKRIEITKESWEKENELEIEQFLDYSALMGDNGDNIFGIPGWGEKTAKKEVKKYNSWEGVIKAYKEKYKQIIAQYPNLDEEEFKNISSVKTESERDKYPQIQFGMPYTGLIKAFEEGKIKLPKTVLMAMVFEERVCLAYSLKKMDDEIQGLPAINQFEKDTEKLKEYFEYYDINSLVEELESINI